MLVGVVVDADGPPQTVQPGAQLTENAVIRDRCIQPETHVRASGAQVLQTGILDHTFVRR